MPKTVLWVMNLLLIYVLLFTAFRLAMLLLFIPEDEPVLGTIPSLLLGLRFDLRWIGFLLAPILLASMHAAFSPFYSEKNKKAWTWYLALATFVVVFFFAADFGCFSYNETRLNASALNFAEDPGTSLHMIWESYPILWFLAALFAAVLVLRWMFWKTHVYVVTKTDGRGIPYQRKWIFVSCLVIALFIHGSFSPAGLRWNNAFGLQNNFKAHLALNPLQNFFSTLRFRKPQKENKAADVAPVMKEWLGLDGNSFDYKRLITPLPSALHAQPNVVLVFCESFSMYKSSMSGNPLDATPFFASMADSGVFFERCFSPHFSTARGLFATVTGIPDVQLSKFSTRNPEALDQHTIINDFDGYKKLYFLGGDPAFNNFKGLLGNIKDLEMHTAGSFKSNPVNVWGISDKDLFLEANKTFAAQKEPFFALVQTADNHRPFMIPEGETAFQKKTIHPDTLKRHGFESVEEYNAFRYSDYCFQVFMEAARKEAYFANTVFVFVGDHGVSGNAKATYGDLWTKQRLTDEHVPLLFYAPGKLTAERRTEVVSQIDVLPTIASLTGQTYSNTTLGRDVINKGKGEHGAFIIHHDEGRIGVVTNEAYFTRNLNFEKEELHFFGRHSYTARQVDSIKTRLGQTTAAYYETSKWMLLNNKKSRP
ncbi:MAG TPA: sulfatase-like hydrolase/transferase [Flavisolibacter sp.]